MNTILIPLLQVLNIALELYMWVIIISVILSWLVAFNVINTQNQFVRTVGGALHQITEPPLSRIRRVVPIMGGLDLSPVVLILGIIFLQLVINRIIILLAT